MKPALLLPPDSSFLYWSQAITGLAWEVSQLRIMLNYAAGGRSMYREKPNWSQSTRRRINPGTTKPRLPHVNPTCGPPNSTPHLVPRPPPEPRHEARTRSAPNPKAKELSNSLALHLLATVPTGSVCFRALRRTRFLLKASEYCKT